MIPPLLLTVGFAFLPFLWFVNFFWFFKYAFRSDQDQENGNLRKELRKFVALSGIGSLAWVVVIIAWNVYFQANRANLSWGDDLSFIIPIGRP